MKERTLSVVCLIVAKSSSKPDHFPARLESESDSIQLHLMLMLPKRRSFWEVWDSLSTVLSVLLRLQIRAPSLQCACSNDPMKPCLQTEAENITIRAIQAQGEPDMSELYYNFQIYDSGHF